MTRELWQRHGRRAAVVLLAAALAGALPGAAGAERLARVAFHAGGVDLLPEVAWARAVLTVSGNGADYRYELAAGEPISIGLFDPEGQLLPDGVYRWSLRLEPTRGAAAALRAAAASEGGEARDAWAPQTGTFALRDGLVADPELTEPIPSRPPADRFRAGLPLALLQATGTRAAPPGDDDRAVGARSGVEASSRAAGRAEVVASSTSPAAAAAEDSDRATAARGGRSLEAAAAAPTLRQSAPPPPRPRSDGSNGRPVRDDNQGQP